MQQNLIAPTAEKYLSGVALNAGSSEETTAVQNADSLDPSKSLTDSPLWNRCSFECMISLSWDRNNPFCHNLCRIFKIDWYKNL